MKEPVKQSVPLSFRLESDVVEMIEEINDKVGLSKTKTVEKAIRMFYEEYKRTGKV